MALADPTNDVPAAVVSGDRPVGLANTGLTGPDIPDGFYANLKYMEDLVT